MSEINQIKAVVFDFGGVIIDLYQEKTFDELRSRISSTSHDAVKELCLELEVGRISGQNFIESLGDFFEVRVSNEEVEEIWNRMLGPISSKKVEFLKKLKNTYKVYLLSNTNIVHKNCFDKIWFDAFGETMEEFFDVVICSHEINLRKPDEDIFKYLVKKTSVASKEILFIDDLKENTDSASSIGIQTHTFTKNSSFESLSYLVSSH